MSELPALEVSLVVMKVVTGKRCVVVTTCPPDLSVSDDNLFLLSQGRQRGGGVEVCEATVTSLAIVWAEASSFRYCSKFMTNSVMSN